MPSLKHHRLIHFLQATFLALGLLAGCASHALGMTLETRDNILFATGPIDDDYATFQTALSNPAIDTLVLVNSPGGNVWAGMKIGRLVVDRKLKTIVAGYCVSACSIIFAGGVERRFADNLPPGQTYIGIHGPHDSITQRVVPEAATQFFAFFKQQTGENFDAAVLNTALYDMDDASGMLTVFDPQRSPSRPPEHCSSIAAKLERRCKTFQQHNATTLGLITESVLVTVEIPPSMSPPLQAFGQVLNRPFQDLKSFLKQTAESVCLNKERCISFLSNFEQIKPYSALATSSDGGNAGWAYGADRLDSAMVLAINGCNFSDPAIPHLCEVRLASGMDARPIYAAENDLHIQALKNLNTPAKRFYGDEEYGGFFTQVNEIQPITSLGTTPQSIAGVTTIGTQDLVTLLKSATPPQVVEVGEPSGQALPTAKVFAFGGWSTQDQKLAEKMNLEFARLMPLLAPRLDQALVLYGTRKDFWQSVNAVLRAKKMGYQNVYWYRGGMAAWLAAQLPTVAVLPRAALSLR